MTSAELDAEYRAFVRSLHKDTIETVLESQHWWESDCFRIAALGGHSDEEKEMAEAIELDWRARVHPGLMTLAHGHPDPDVRFAADMLDKRLWSIVMIVRRPHREEPDRKSDDENGVAVHLVHDGFTRLRRAAYYAPFRTARPVPDYDGVLVGNNEPLPGRMLGTVRRLQEAGVIAKDDGIISRSIPDAVQKISDIMFMSKDERTSLFEDVDAQDPTTASDDEDGRTEEREFRFGFGV